MSIGELHPHPAAELFPMMTGPDFDALVDDIKQHGQREPIIVIGDAILDGRNRYAACLRLGVEPVLQEWKADQTPEEFVASMNLHRRHLSVSQRAMIAARLVNTERVHNLRGAPETQNWVSIDKAAELLGVSTGSVSNARTVLAKGTQADVTAIDRGTATVDTMSKQIRDGINAKDRADIRSGKKDSPSKAARVERTRQSTLLWSNLKGALLAINNLPRAADMVSVVLAWDRSKVTDEHLLRALNWLQEFANEWTRRDDQDAA